jgi:ABC-2 type transport system permease protein
MTKATPPSRALEVPPTGAAACRPLPIPAVLSALGALFGLTLRQQARGRRFLILVFLFCLPAVVALLARYSNPGVRWASLEFDLVLRLIANALVPLTALLYASGMIQDEVEDQTLTYLFLRPLPKWAIYLVKLLATLLVTILLTAVFTAVTYLALYGRLPGLGEEILGDRLPKAVALLALALLGYCSLFGCISLLVRQVLLVGVAYIVLFEGLIAGIDFAIRQVTVIYYFRVLALRWLPVDWSAVRESGADDWGIDLNQAPSNGVCVGLVLAASAVLTALAVYLFTTREFRVKTPQGS